MKQTTINNLPAELIRDELFKHIVAMLDAWIMYSAIIVFRKVLTQEYIESIKPLFIKQVTTTVKSSVFTYYTYPNGVKHGECICIDDKYKHIYTYVNDMRQGTYILTNHKSGTMFINNFIDNKLQGITIGYYPTGEKRYYRRHVNGKCQGLSLEYYRVSGNVKRRYNYKDGYVSGQSISYSINGRVKSVVGFVKSHKDGRYIEYYYNTNNIKLILTYKDGKLNGPYKLFYTNGQISKEGYYVDNVEHVTDSITMIHSDERRS